MVDSETIKENVEFDETIKSNNILYLANLVALNDFGEDSKEFLSQETNNYLFNFLIWIIIK